MTLRPAPYAGLYDDEFWAWTARGELRLQRCADCGRFRYPPGPACPDCLGEDFSWEPLSGEATLLSWVVFHRQYFPSLPVPYTVVTVETAEGPFLIGNTDEPAGALRIGRPMRVTFEPAGTITLPQWRAA